MTALTPATLRPGDLMFGPIGRFVPGVLPVGAGQVLLASRKDRLSWRRWWHVRHVAVVVEASRTLPPGTVRHAGGQYVTEIEHMAAGRNANPGSTFYPTGVITAPRIVQAMPSGAEEIDMSQEKHWTAQHVYLRPNYNFVLDQAGRAAEAARGYVGTPYGFLTYAALAARGAGLESEALARYITSRKEMICSQLADQALTDAGFHVFTDGRLPQDVVPAELYRRLLTMDGTRLLVPGDERWM